MIKKHLVFVLVLFFFTAFEVLAQKDIKILSDHGQELKIKSLDAASSKTKEEYCDIAEPHLCDPIIKEEKPKANSMKVIFKKIKYQDLSKQDQALLDAADQVSNNSYSPYSHFHVGAALLSTDGEIVTGTNFENAAYGSTICAERAAILRANAQGKKKFSKIAIIGRGKDFDTLDPVSPCGACRQVLLELAQASGVNIEVIMSNSKKDAIVVSTIEDLLPLGFGPKNLGIRK